MNFLTANKTLPSNLVMPNALKYTAQSLQFFSHKLALLFAAKLFSTPFTFKTPKKEKGMEESSQHKKLFVTAIQKEIHILSYGYSNKKVLLAHGWAGRSTQFYMIAHKLLEKGYMVISFDGPSHGKSPGKTTNLMEYIETVKSINTEYGPFDAAIGHSFGAMGIMNTQADNEIFKTMAIIGAGDKVPDILSNFVNNLGLKPIISKKLQAYFQKKWDIELKDFATNEVAKKVKTPVLVIHDANDGDVAVSCALNIRQNLKSGSLFITSELGHTKILRDSKVTDRIVKYIIQNT